MAALTTGMGHNACFHEAVAAEEREEGGGGGGGKDPNLEGDLGWRAHGLAS
jgi:hypothetical protein